MSQSANAPVSEAGRVILDEIKRVFGNIRRGAGVTLHETQVIDNCGSDEEREQARRKDTDENWWEVQDEWIEQNVGLTFLDDAGFRYYLPAYMSYWIRAGQEPWGLEFQLGKHDRIERIFSRAEKTMIARFLDYVGPRFDDFSPGEALDEFWRQYFNASSET